MQRAFAYHPFITILPLSGEPPEQYEIAYRVRTLAMGEDQTLRYIKRASVHLWLGPDFPDAAPLARPMAELFHPNIAPQAIRIGDDWSARRTLTDLVSVLGQLLAYQRYDSELAENPAAVEWIIAHPSHVPTDPDADFYPNSGGAPIERMLRYGPATLDDIARRVEQARASIESDAGSVTPEALDDFLMKTARAVELFLGTEVPASLHDPAERIVEQLGAIREHADRRHRDLAAMARVRAIEQAIQQADEACARSHQSCMPLLELGDGLCPPAESAHPMRVAAAIPPVSVLGPLLKALSAAVETAREKVGDIEKTFKQADSPRVDGAAGSVPRREVGESEAGRALASARPLLAESAQCLAAGKRLLAWRELSELLDEGEALVRRLAVPDAIHESTDCPALAGRFDALAERGSKRLAELSTDPLRAPGWMAAFMVPLSRPDARMLLATEHRKATHRWIGLREDLMRLAPYQKRIAFFRTLERLGTALREDSQVLRQARAMMADAERDLVEIVARSSRDLETDRLLVPAKLAAAYSSHIARRDASRHQIESLAPRVQETVEQLRALLADEDRGDGSLPALSSLGAQAVEGAALVPWLDDEAIEALIADIESASGMGLR